MSRRRRALSWGLVCAACATLGVLVASAESARAEDLADVLPGLADSAASQFSASLGAPTGPAPFTARGLFDDRAAVNNLAGGVAGQLTNNYPIGSTVAAFTFEFDPVLNVYRRSTDGLGPLLSERAETTGKGKLNVAFAASYIDFDLFEGERLSSLDVDLKGTLPTTVTGTADADMDGMDDPIPVPGGGSIDIIGDIAVGPGSPFEFVVDCGSLSFCSFDPDDPMATGSVTPSGSVSGSGPAGRYTVRATSPDVIFDADIRARVAALFLNYGVSERFDLGLVVPYLDIEVEGESRIEGLRDPTTGAPLPPQTLSRQERSAGLGDIILRGKGQILEHEWANVAGRLDVFLPTGDEDDLRGYGDPAVGMLLAASQSFGRFEPHANVGLLLRGGGKNQHEWRYGLGVDVRLAERLTVTTDLRGTRDLNRDGFGDNTVSLATGLKVNPWRRLVVAGNLLWRLNRQGLRADVVPTLSLEYTFR